jgi:hypothetical protein
MPLSLRLRKTVFASGIALWLGVAGWGTKQLNDYSFQAAETGVSAPGWPSESSLSREKDKFTLVLALHPECPCSRATLSELDVILAQTNGAVSAVAVFLDSDPAQPATASALFRKVAKIPGVSVICDRDGSELKKFGFCTSGETRLYRADGSLIFVGGVTGSRGHEGDNPGREAVISLTRDPANRAHPAVVKRPSFGCALFDPS